MSKTLLFVGLGNPEGKYFQTYHNLGFLAADALAGEFGVEFKKKGNQMLAVLPRAGSGVFQKVFILKPLTYMNLSGQAVVALCRKQKIEPENVIVFLDEIHIDKGKLRITMGGSGGGHNGLRSITELLGTNKYARIRIGIKPEKPPHSTSKYVLSKIEERELFANTIQKAMEAAKMLIAGKALHDVQQEFNCKND